MRNCLLFSLVRFFNIICLRFILTLAFLAARAFDLSFPTFIFFFSSSIPSIFFFPSSLSYLKERAELWSLARAPVRLATNIDFFTGFFHNLDLSKKRTVLWFISSAIYIL